MRDAQHHSRLVLPNGSRGRPVLSVAQRRGRGFQQALLVLRSVRRKDRRRSDDTEAIPIALLKNRKYGLYNTFFEVDLTDENVAWGTKYTVQPHREMDELGVRQHQQQGADPHQFSRPARRHGGIPGAPVERGAIPLDDARR